MTPRFDSMRKLDRNKEIKEFVESHPELSYKEVGIKYGLSRARIWIIAHPKNTDRKIK